ncbi:MAG: MBL fold metallo-hydrolase [Gemmatimonadaceae bacterium]|jgi:phosphoribosyl 1,2-cyclic phosphodiesterase|nr:MBL fold metallo-hydrolase [Gemmatimonadaceae bacterium]
MRVTVLGSGSRGNAIVVEGGGMRVLVDAGFSPRALQARLAAARMAPESIDALLLTHEHTDHASGAADAVARWGWPVVATAGTFAALPALREASRMVLTATSALALGALDVAAVPIAHDAREPVALVLADRHSGARAAIALDLGRAPDDFAQALGPLDLLVIEANHDAQRLADGPYPAMLKRRISGGSGHLSNAQTAHLLGACARVGLGAVILAHLSETNNTPELALGAVRPALRAAGWRTRALHVATQGAVLHPVASAQRDARQLALDL